MPPSHPRAPLGGTLPSARSGRGGEAAAGMAPSPPPYLTEGEAAAAATPSPAVAAGGGGREATIVGGGSGGQRLLLCQIRWEGRWQRRVAAATPSPTSALLEYS